MNFTLKSIFLSTAMAAMILPVAAQDSPTTTPSPTPPPAVAPPPSAVKTPSGNKTVADRKESQQDRIGQGMQSGELTPEEAARLEHREAKLNKETERMRAANGGTLTDAQKAKIEKQQNKLSQQIRNQKHDAQSQPDRVADNTIAKHKESEQDRIANGVSNGSLTPAEASKLENQETHINNETQRLRAKNGGDLTDAEKQKIEHQQKQISKKINNQKHDSQKQPHNH